MRSNNDDSPSPFLAAYVAIALILLGFGIVIFVLGSLLWPV